jgi:O-antigen ligase
MRKSQWAIIKNKNELVISNKKIFFSLFLVVLLITLSYFYQLRIIPSNTYLNFYLNGFLIIFFIIAIRSVKFGLYIMVFLIPLLNFIPILLNLGEFSIISIIFLYLLAGMFLNGFYESSKNNLLVIFAKKLSFPKELFLPVFLFSVLIIVSSIITIYRYLNFYPIISPFFHNLNVNINGMKASDAITLVIKFLLNYLIGFLLVFFLYNCIKTIKEIITCIIILVSSTIISSFVVLYQVFFNPSFGNFEPWITSGRFNATFTDPNALGTFTVLAFPLFLILIIYFKKWYVKVLFSTLFLLFLPLIYFAGSRSALIGILISIIVFITIGLKELSKASRRKRSIILIIVAIILIIIILASVLLIKTDNKLKDKIAASGIVMKSIETIKAAVLYFKIDSLTEAIKSISNYRYILWKRAFQMVKDYPLSGLGSGTFIIELPDYNWKYDKAFLQVDYPGNYYLQIFAEFGLPGLIILLAIFALIIKKYRSYLYFNKKFKILDKNKIIIYGLFVSFISMLIILFLGSHNNMVEIQITFWLLIGFIFSYIKIYKNKEIVSINIVQQKANLAAYNDFGEGSVGQIFKEKLIKNKLRLTSFIIIFIIFTSSFIYSSYTNLSINIKQNLFNWSDFSNANTYGFYGRGNTGIEGPRWTSYDASTSIKRTGDKLSFALKAQNPDLRVNPLYVKVLIDNSLIKEFKLTDDKWHKYTLKLRTNNRKSITFSVIPSRTWNPQKMGISDDNRDLGVMVGNIEFLK